MRYRDLLKFLSELSAEQLDQTVSVYDCMVDEYHPAHSATFTVGEDVLDDNHPILIIK